MQASDGTLSTQTTVTVKITDVNEAPKFASDDGYSFTLAENTDGSGDDAIAIGTVSATDPDANNNTVKYSIVSGNDAKLFKINDETGAITYVGTGEDFESGNTTFTLTVRASDGERATQATVTINVTDVDDSNQTPEFSDDNYVFTLAENEDGSNSAVAVDTVSATDPENGTVMYSIVSGNGNGLFAIDGDGAITYVGTGEDFESHEGFELTVRASDGNTSSQATVTVNVTNVNEAPVFASDVYEFELDGNADGSVTPVTVGPVSATDPENDDITYSISGTNSNLFQISSNGQITYVGSGSDSANLPETFSLTITASDDSIDTEVTVTINIEEDDVGNYKPLTNKSGDSILSQTEESRIEDSEPANQPVEAKNTVSDSAGPGARRI